MKRTQISSLPKKLQLLKLSGRLQRSVENGEFEKLPGQKQKQLIGRIERLQKQLNHRLPGFKMSHAFAVSTLALGMATGIVKAQPAYTMPVDTPFGLNVNSSAVFVPSIDFADMDNDGDLDAVLLDSAGYYLFSFTYKENVGTPTAPAFQNATSNPFDPFTVEYLAFVDMVDMDNDGDYDQLFITYDGANYGPILVYRENIGTVTAPAFDTAQVNAFGIMISDYEVAPRAVDIDADGDNDLIIGDYYGNFNFYENTGTPTAPAFAAPVTNPFGITQGYYIVFPDFADFDLDGDLDMMVGAYEGGFEYYENIGSDTLADFDAPTTNPFGLDSTYYYNLPVVADIDGDGDFDIISGQYNYYDRVGFLFFEDTTTVTGITAPIEMGEWTVYPNPTRGHFTVEINSGIKGEVGFELINGVGQIMVQDRWLVYNEGLSKRVSVAGLSPGLYFVRLEAEGLPMVKKLILR